MDTTQPKLEAPRAGRFQRFMTILNGYSASLKGRPRSQPAAASAPRSQNEAALSASDDLDIREVRAALSDWAALSQQVKRSHTNRSADRP
jgi:hypothetical protein